jgi:hypothetical protein
MLFPKSDGLHVPDIVWAGELGVKGYDGLS